MATLDADDLAAISTMVNGRTTLYVSPSGNNSNSGLTPALAKLTIGAAKTAATAGTLIRVMPGTYDERDLLKDGVDYHFAHGAKVVYTGSGGDIFDDGGTDCISHVSGEGVFEHRGTGAARTIVNLSGGGSYVVFNYDTIYSLGRGFITRQDDAILIVNGRFAECGDGVFDSIGTKGIFADIVYARSSGFIVECDGEILDVRARRLEATDGNSIEVANGSAVVRDAYCIAAPSNPSAVVGIGYELVLHNCSMAQNSNPPVEVVGTLKLVGSHLDLSDIAISAPGSVKIGESVNSDAATAATQSTTAATEIGKVPRSATAVAAGGDYAWNAVLDTANKLTLNITTEE